MDGHGREGNQGVTGRGLTHSESAAKSARDWSQRAASRSNCYGLLALVFRDVPTSETVTRMRSAPLAEVLRDYGYDIARDLAGEPGTVAERLGQDYTRAFVGPGEHVSPYASVHRADEGQLWGESTVQVKRFVQRTGLSFQGHWDSIPDHVAIEFELMQRLCGHEAELWPRATSGRPDQTASASELAQCVERQAELLRDHLSVWLPRFCQRVLDASNSPFYREMAKLAGSIVAADIEHVAAAKNVLEPD